MCSQYEEEKLIDNFYTVVRRTKRDIFKTKLFYCYKVVQSIYTVSSPHNQLYLSVTDSTKQTKDQSIKDNTCKRPYLSVTDGMRNNLYLSVADSTSNRLH